MVRPTDDPKGTRLALRVSDDFLAELDDWRRHQTEIPPRAAAIRDLVSLGLQYQPVFKALETAVRILISDEMREHVSKERLVALVTALLEMRVQGAVITDLLKDAIAEKPSPKRHL